jgi:hypothetical protein
VKEATPHLQLVHLELILRKAQVNVIDVLQEQEVPIIEISALIVRQDIIQTKDHQYAQLAHLELIQKEDIIYA